MKEHPKEGEGEIALTPDYELHTLRLEVGGLTVRLQPEEAKMVSRHMIRLGNMLWGHEWGESTLEWSEDVPGGKPFLLYPRRPGTRRGGEAMKAKAFVKRCR